MTRRRGGGAGEEGLVSLQHNAMHVHCVQWCLLPEAIVCMQLQLLFLDGYWSLICLKPRGVIGLGHVNFIKS